MFYLLWVCFGSFVGEIGFGDILGDVFWCGLCVEFFLVCVFEVGLFCGFFVVFDYVVFVVDVDIE